MIRESGQIIGLNRDQSKAVQSVLMSKGYTWGGNYLSYPMLDTPNVYWYENKRLMLVPPMGGDLAPHTLADFGLTPEGEPMPKFKDGDRVVPNEALKQVISEGGLNTTYDAYKEPFVLSRLNPEALEATNEYGRFNVSNKGIVYNLDGDYVGHILHAPTFGNLKPGDPNPFEVGMEVTCRRLRGRVEHVSDYPAILVSFGNLGRWWIGWTASGFDYSSTETINDIFPVERASQPEKPRFEFGDKVKVGKRMYRFLCYTQDRLSLICSDYEFDHATLGPYDVSARSVMAEDVTPWPTPTTIPLNDNHTATVTPDGITVGCQTFPLSIIDHLVEARKKMEQ